MRVFWGSGGGAGTSPTRRFAASRAGDIFSSIPCSIADAAFP